MSASFTVALALGIAALLFWAGMSGRLEPSSRWARHTLNAALGIGGAVAGLIALAWFLLITSLIF
ncbi:MAG: hypothetical protein PGN23_04150 [Sphingomonas adhaesiva]|uniref:hypothetical protein n=1 Tax=Sphingomonas adhaesiva TaxID=28212 RepID=UPI002FFB6A12